LSFPGLPKAVILIMLVISMPAGAQYFGRNKPLLTDTIDKQTGRKILFSKNAGKMNEC